MYFPPCLFKVAERPSVEDMLLAEGVMKIDALTRDEDGRYIEKHFWALSTFDNKTFFVYVPEHKSFATLVCEQEMTFRATP